ncbi:MAG: hypothetical protein D6160_21830 [Ketobacter sp.]|nr:MAG: hypothetical protein D6160_21830 [Ketobacter sp.]|tara:strand:+ start:365 stop:547 length:183 start_codon:yes stop_codon:yes gene_type:complete
MKLTDLSLRKHIVLIVLIKVLVIIAIRLIFFPSLEQQHLPADIYFDTSEPQTQPLRRPHD